MYELLITSSARYIVAPIDVIKKHQKAGVDIGKKAYVKDNRVYVNLDESEALLDVLEDLDGTKVMVVKGEIDSSFHHYE